jgi:hypothetical protein
MNIGYHYWINKMKKYLWTVNKIILIVTLSLILFGLAATPVAAQSQTVLSIEPAQMEVPLGNEVVLEVDVLLGLNINAFDLTVVYDPAVLSLEAWEHGDYLDNLANIKIEEDPGFLRVAATQLATPAVSGDGTLLEITFNTLAAGQSAVELVDVTFSDSDGDKTEPVLEEGIVDVVHSATYTPTPTPTNTPTPKPTVTPQPTDDGSGYPVKNDPTRTATTAAGAYSPTEPVEGGEEGGQPTATAENYPSGPGETIQGTPEDQSGYPGDEASEDSGTAGQNDEVAADGVSERAPDQAETAGQSVLNALLWAVLVLAMLALIGMVIIVVRRRKQKHEDYLL